MFKLVFNSLITQVILVNIHNLKELLPITNITNRIISYLL